MTREIPALAQRLEHHGPDEPEGFSESRLKALLTDEEFADFKAWIKHQTIKVYASMAIYYIDDVLRWAYGLERWRVTDQSVSQ